MFIICIKYGVCEVFGFNVGVCVDFVGNDRNVYVMDKIGSVFDVFVFLIIFNYVFYFFFFMLR